MSKPRKASTDKIRLPDRCAEEALVSGMAATVGMAVQGSCRRKYAAAPERMLVTVYWPFTMLTGSATLVQMLLEPSAEVDRRLNPGALVVQDRTTLLLESVMFREGGVPLE